MSITIISIIIMCTLLSGCANPNTAEDIAAPLQDTSALSNASDKPIDENHIIEIPIDTLEVSSALLINPDGMTLKERFYPPDGFSRLEGEKDSFAEFLQSIAVKPDGSKVKYFDGREKLRDVYMAVVDYSLDNRDLQQCADAVMRLRAEYLYGLGKRDSISFNFVNGFTANFSQHSLKHGSKIES